MKPVFKIAGVIGAAGSLVGYVYYIRPILRRRQKEREYAMGDQLYEMEKKSKNKIN